MYRDGRKGVLQQSSFEALIILSKIKQFLFCQVELLLYFCTPKNRELAERSNAAVLKTVDCNRSGGSNPSLSAETKSSGLHGGF